MKSSALTTISGVKMIYILRSLALVAMLVLPTVSYAVPVVSVGSATKNVGDVFTIPVSITDAVNLMSWQFDLSFNHSIVQANSITEGPFLSSSGTKMTLFGSGVIDNGTGLISLVTDSYVDLVPGPSGAGVLANIEFKALALGLSPLTVSNAFLDFSDTGFQVTPGLVTVQTSSQDRCFLSRVPLPCSVWALEPSRYETVFSGQPVNNLQNAGRFQHAVTRSVCSKLPSYA